MSTAAKIEQPTDAIIRVTTSAIDAYETFDRREDGWLETTVPM